MRVLLDSSALIAVVSGEPGAEQLSGLLDMLDRGEAQLVASVLTLSEVYRRSSDGNARRRDSYNARLDQVRARLEAPATELLDVTLPVARKATELRGTYRLATVDAVHVATAILNRCDWIVSFDRKFPSLPQLQLFDMARVHSGVSLPWVRPIQDVLDLDESLSCDNVTTLRRESDR